MTASTATATRPAELPDAARPAYLDHAATTPCDARVLAEMLPWFTELPANPANTSHGPGRAARDAVERARAQVASFLGGRPEQVAFTSGATESNNLALRGTACIAREAGSTRTRVLVSAIEHRSVTQPAELLAADDGLTFDEIPVDGDGIVDLAALEALLEGDDVLLVSVHGANNELGTIQPIADVSRLARAAGALVHTDAAQLLGKVPTSVDELGVDLLSLTAHKFYGPKGVGAIWIRAGIEAGTLRPTNAGGGQESGLRSGTSNVPGIVGLGAACDLAAAELADGAHERLAALRDRFEAQLLADAALAGVRVTLNGHREQRVPGVSSVTVHGADGRELVAALPALAISRGSACSTDKPKASHVLQAIGMSEPDAFATLRISLGASTTAEQVDAAASMIVGAAAAHG